MKYITFLILFVFSIVWGRGILFMHKHGISKRVTMWVMNYIMCPYSMIEDIFLNCYYNVVGLMGIVVFSICFDIPLFQKFLIVPQALKFIILAPLAVLSLANIIISCITPIFNGDVLTDEMMQIPWVNFTSRVNPKLGPLIPCIGALLEEIFFRGVVFYYAFYICNFHFAISFFISFCMFALQQMLFTANKIQSILMLFGALIVSLISCMVIVISDSLLPAILSHEIFVIFYFSKMGFQYQASNSAKKV